MQQGGKDKRDTSGAVAIQVPYLRVVGIEEEVEGAHSTPTFTYSAHPLKCHGRSLILAPLKCIERSCGSLSKQPNPVCVCGACRAQEEAEFREFAARPNVLDLIPKRIAPQIFGSERIKEAVACLLFGGSRKVGSILSAADFQYRHTIPSSSRPMQYIYIYIYGGWCGCHVGWCCHRFVIDVKRMHQHDEHQGLFHV